MPQAYEGTMTDQIDHLSAQQLLAVYALGACEEAERIAVEGHITGCPSCIADLQSLAAAVQAIEVAPATSPPAELRTRVLCQALDLDPPGRARSHWSAEIHPASSPAQYH